VLFRSLWGMKDPRLCFTLQFVLPHLEDARLVAVSRAPSACVESLMHHSARSYHGKEAMTFRQATDLHDLWMEAMDRRLREFQGPILDVRYEALVQDRGRGVAALASFAFSGTGLRPDLPAGMRFIDGRLKHHG